MIIQSRRNFIIGLTSSLAAPAIVRASSLMKVKAIEKNFGDIILQWANEAQDLEDKKALLAQASIYYNESTIDILYDIITVLPWCKDLFHEIEK